MKLKCFIVKGTDTNYQLNPDPKLSEESISLQIAEIVAFLAERGITGVQIDPVFENSTNENQSDDPSMSLEEVTQKFLEREV